MATRTISTKLEIEGEASYKQAIANVNSELKNLRSELGLVQAQYQNHQNSMEALSAKEQALTAIHTAQSSKLETLKSYLQSTQTAQSKYAAEVEKLKSSLTTVNSALAAMDPKVVEAGKSWANYAKEAKEAEAELKTLQSSSGDTSAQQQELTQKLADAKAKMAELETATGGAAKEAGEMVMEQQQLQSQLTQSESAYDRSTRAVNNLQAQTNNAQKELYNTGAELEQTRKYLDEASASADGCATSIDEFGRQAKQSGEDAENAFAGLKNALAALGVAKAVKEITDALGACVEAADAFEYKMAYVETLADTSSAAWGTMEDDIISLSNAYGIAATELSGAAYQALSAGVTTADAAEFLETASQLSVAGMTTTTSAVDLLTNAINVYGLESADAARISDELLQVQNLGKTTINELASVYSVAATQAGAFDVSIENLNTGFAILTKNGINTANAGTLLSSMFTELADEGSTVAQILKEKTGMSFQQLNDAGYSLGDTMQVLWESVNGNSTSFSNLWSNVRAGRAALNIAQTGAEEFNRVLGRISDSAGLTSESYSILADTGTTAANRMSAAADNLKIAFGDALSPAVEKANNLLADLFSGAADLISACPALASAVASVSVALVTLSAGTVVLSNLPAIISAVTTAVKTMVTVVSGSTGGALLLFASLAAAAATFIATLDTGETELQQFTDEVNELTAALDESKAAFDETTEEIGRSAEEDRALVSSLEELLAVEEKTAAEKARITAIVASLNSSVDGLTLSYDEQADALNMTAYAIYDCIDAQENQASNATKMERLAAIEEERAHIAVKLAEAEANAAEAGEIVNDVLKQTGDMDPFDPHLKALTTYANQVLDLKERDAALVAETEELSATVDAYASAMDGATDSTEDMLDPLDKLEQAYQEAYESAKESLEGQFDLWEEVGEVSEKSAADLKKALDSQIEYWQNYGANRDNVLSRGIDGLDEYVAAIDDGSTDAAAILAGLADASDEELQDIVSSYQDLQSAQDDLSQNMADNATDYTETMAEMNRCAHSATDDIASYFADLRVTAPNLVSGLPADINSALAGPAARAQYDGAGTTMHATFADAVAAGRTPVYNAASGLGSNATRGLKSTSSYAAWYSVGTDAANGFIDAMTAKQAKVKAVGSGIGSSSLAGVKTALRIKSPSRKFMELGDYSVQGYEEGVKKRLPNALQVVKDAALSSYNAFAAGVSDTRRRAADSGLGSAPPAGGTAKNAVSLGGVNVTINTQPGQDAKEIADAVMRRIQHEVNRRGAAF